MKKQHTTILWALISIITVTPGYTQSISRALGELARLNTEKLHKGEFETTKKFEMRQEEIQKNIDSILIGNYSESVNIKFGRYDADSEILPIQLRLQGFDEVLQLIVPPAEAKAIKEYSPALMGHGEFWIEDNSKVFLNGQLSIIINGKRHLTRPGSVQARIFKTNPPLPKEVYNSRPYFNFLLLDNGDHVARYQINNRLIDLVDLSSGRIIQTFNQKCNKQTFSSSGLRLACFKGRYSNAGKVHIYDRDNSEAVWIFPWRNQGSYALAFSPDEKIIATSLGLWNIAEKTKIKGLSAGKYLDNIVFSPDGQLIAANYKSHLWMIDVKSGNLIFELDHAYVSAFSRSGDVFLEGRELRNSRTGDQIVTFEDGMPTFLSPDESLAASGYRTGGYKLGTKIWNAKTGKLLRTIQGYRAYGFLPSGLLLVADEYEIGTADYLRLSKFQIVNMAQNQ